MLWALGRDPRAVEGAGPPSRTFPMIGFEVACGGTLGITRPCCAGGREGLIGADDPPAFEGASVSSSDMSE